MTDNTTPRELDPAELAAIRERDAAYRQIRETWWDTHAEDPNHEAIDWTFRNALYATAYDVPALLAHVASVDARCRAYEAALADVDQLISYPEESGCARGDVGCLLDKVRKVAFDALLRAANGDGGRGNDGSDGNGSGEAGT